MENALKKIKNDSRIRTGYFSGFIFLLIACLATLYANRQLTSQSKRVEDTNRIISNLEAMLSEVKDAETGIRGYLINHDSSFLQPYTGSRRAMDSIFNLVKEQTKDNESQQIRLSELRQTLEKRYFVLQENIDVYNRNRKMIIDTIYIQQVTGKRLMDEVRRRIAEIQVHEAELLNIRNQKLARDFRALNIIIISTLVIAVGIVIFGFITHTKERKARREAERKIINYQDELKNRIAQLDKANQELIQMRSQEKFAATGRMARTIAHEVRNPLTNINLAVDQLKGEMTGPAENTDFLFEMIGRNSHRINQLISDLLNSTKFSELSFNKVSINKLLDEALQQAQDRVALTNIELIRNYSTDICDVSVDNERIKIAMLNIIINALEAMEGREGSKLWLETRGENNRCKVIIRDNGPGMDEEAVSKIFEPYFTSKQNGNGLGLTNTQNIILNHKGDISVSSRVEEGTSFIITLNFA